MYKLTLILFSVVVAANCAEPNEKNDKATNNLVINNGVNNGANNGANNGDISINNGSSNPCPDGQTLASVNGQQACFTSCESESDCAADNVCVQDVCISASDSCNSNDDCAAAESCVNGSCVEKDVDACESAVDCNADQRCANQVCTDLLFCDDRTFRDIDRARCEFTWKGCDDGKDYDLICADDDEDGQANCECKINGVVVATPTVEFNSMVCGQYRTVNEACDWFLETSTP